jgi:hypothetical protein
VAGDSRPGILGYDTARSGTWLSKFWRRMLDFRRKAQVVFFSETLLPSYQSARYRNPVEYSSMSNSYSKTIPYAAYVTANLGRGMKLREVGGLLDFCCGFLLRTVSAFRRCVLTPSSGIPILVQVDAEVVLKRVIMSVVWECWRKCCQ